MKTILLIDDELGVRESIKIILPKEYRIHEAETVEEGFQMLKECKPDLIITDHKTPGSMTGLDLLHQLHADKDEIPIMMISGSHIENEAKQLG
jgi:CheY-like chemotaxis protein